MSESKEQGNPLAYRIYDAFYNTTSVGFVMSVSKFEFGRGAQDSAKHSRVSGADEGSVRLSALVGVHLMSFLNITRKTVINCCQQLLITTDQVVHEYTIIKCFCST